jgi:hypothetical protein
VLFSDEQKLLFKGGKKGFVKNTKLDFYGTLTLSRRQLEKKIGQISRKWRFRNFLPPYATSPKTHLSSS